MIAAVCFDFYGTLAHRPEDPGAVWDRIRAELALLHCDFDGFPWILRAELARDGAVTLTTALEATLRALGQRWDDDLPAVAARAVDAIAAPTRLLPGARALLDDLAARGTPLALLDRSPADVRRASIAAVGLDGAFRWIGRDPALACEALGRDPGEVCRVGDDLAGARSLGMQVVRVGPDGVPDLIALREWLAQRLG